MEGFNKIGGFLLLTLVAIILGIFMFADAIAPINGTCPQDMHFDCRFDCQQWCHNTTLFCSSKCKAGCYCQPGKLLNHQAVCVLPQDCKKTTTSTTTTAAPTEAEPEAPTEAPTEAITEGAAQETPPAE